MTRTCTETVVITGASSGIGAVAARRLAQRGATFVPVGRSPDATAAIAAEVGTEPLIVDYARLADVRALAERRQPPTSRRPPPAPERHAGAPDDRVRRQPDEAIIDRLIAPSALPGSLRTDIAPEALRRPLRPSSWSGSRPRIATTRIHPSQALRAVIQSLTVALSRSTLRASLDAKGFCRLRQPGFAAHS
jgi:hypothetical protein